MTIHDENLYKRIQSNDKDALRILYRKYEKLLYTYAYRMTSDESLSEEVIQDVFLTVWQKKSAYQPDKGKLSTWLITLTRNSVIDQLRKKKIIFQNLDENDTSVNKNPDSPIEIEILTGETNQHIADAVKKLSKKQQEIIHLFYFKAYSQSQIATTLDIPLGTVKSRLRLAVKHLKKNMHINQKGGAHNENA